MTMLKLKYAVKHVLSKKIVVEAHAIDGETLENNSEWHDLNYLNKNNRKLGIFPNEEIVSNSYFNSKVIHFFVPELDR